MSEWCRTCEKTTQTMEVHHGPACGRCKSLRPLFQDATHEGQLVFWTEENAYQYEIHTGTKKPVEPRESWQQAEYERVMGHEPPDLSLPQFDYNPRTKTGKALLEELTDNDS